MLPYLIVFGLLVFQIGISIWLWTNPHYLPAEKRAQTQLIWLLPLIGATIVGVMLLEERRERQS